MAATPWTLSLLKVSMELSAWVKLGAGEQAVPGDGRYAYIEALGKTAAILVELLVVFANEADCSTMRQSFLLANIKTLRVVCATYGPPV